jgi:hypothetical protein
MLSRFRCRPKTQVRAWKYRNALRSSDLAHVIVVPGLKAPILDYTNASAFDQIVMRLMVMGDIHNVVAEYGCYLIMPAQKYRVIIVKNVAAMFANKWTSP